MSDEPEKSSKTEEPSERKMAEARRKGDVPISKEASNLAAVAGMALVASVLLPSVVNRLLGALLPLTANFHAIRIAQSYDDVLNVVWRTIEIAAFALAPVFLLMAGGGLAAVLAQNAFVISTERITPKLDRISPAKGVERLFSGTALVEFMKSVFKVAVVAIVVGLFIWDEVGKINEAVSYDLTLLPQLLRDATLALLLAVLAAMIVIAGVDILWRRFEWKNKQRMTKQEVKDEFKQSEGDPQVKARLAEIRRNRGRKRMMAAVPGATVVIANPTHYSVALRYVREETDSPICVAKGQNLVALKIREIAEQNNVPVLENKPLARGLYGSVEVDQAIPAEYFEAVAEVITYVYKHNKRNVTA
ncbi:MAG: flagellar biosynthesis protein FlhB [Pseudomonadota bacterium]